uniref:Class I SAM-dependent methyltransferase n=1 Tax=Ignisphaera aggregans TaxID=334771 RepID=A0A7J3YTI3_9CREN
MNAREALLSIEDVIKQYGDQRATYSFYFEFGRRLEVLELVKTFCKPGATVLDIGAQPFITSCALKKLGYEVIALDIEPEPYIEIAKSCDVNVIKCDLEKDELGVTDTDCAVFTEVLEHLHYYYAPIVLARINRFLKVGGHLILTTPNIASLFRRLRLILGEQPIYKYHVREYTMNEVLTMVREAGFDVVKAYYSAVNDLTYIDAKPEEYLKTSGYIDLIKMAIKRPVKLNVLRTLAYPLVKMIPSLRQLIVVIDVKKEEPSLKGIIARW